MARKTNRSGVRHDVLAVAVVAALAAPAGATTFTWLRPTANDALWTTAGNWIGGVAPKPDSELASGEVQDVVFAGDAANPFVVGTHTMTNQPGVNFTVNSFEIKDVFTSTTMSTSFPAPAPPAANPVLSIGAGGLLANNKTFNANFGSSTNFAGTINLKENQTWTVNSPADGSFNVGVFVPVTGKSLTKEGDGLLILSKRSIDWQGDENGVTVYLKRGTIRTGGGNEDPVTGLNYQFGKGIVDVQTDNNVSITASSVTNDGGGGTRTFANTFRFGGMGSMSFGGSFDINFPAASKWILNADKDISLSRSGGGTYRMDGVISGDFGFRKLGGGTLILGNANTHAGATRVGNGTLRLENALALQSSTLSVQLPTATSTPVFSFGPLTSATLGGIAGPSDLALSNAVGAAVAVTVGNNGQNTVHAGTITGPGSLTKVGAGTTETKQLNTTGQVSVTGGTLKLTAGTNSSVGSLAVSGGGKLDVTTNTLSVADTSAPQVTAVRAALASAYAAGKWDGPGIGTSSAAAAGYATTLGYGVAGGQLVVKYTLPGDATLDGTVNSADVAAMTSGADWMHGDFNYDGKLSSDDFALLSLGAATGTLPAQSAVPEPGAVGLALTGAAALVARRRRAAGRT